MSSRMESVRERLRVKLSPEDYEFAIQIMELSPSGIRSFIEEMVEDLKK